MSETITTTDRTQYLTSTVNDLIESAKKDISVAPILADALQDAGYENANIDALRSTIGRYTLAEWLYDNLGLDISTVKADRLTIAASEVQLSAANGRRRVRILGLDRVQGLVRHIRNEQLVWDTTAGETVANKYGYPAHRTMCIIVVRTDGVIRIRITEGTANKGSSVSNQTIGLRANQDSSLFRQWADKVA